jgi:hypothetical protein
LTTSLDVGESSDTVTAISPRGDDDASIEVGARSPFPSAAICRSLIGLGVLAGIYVRFWYATHQQLDGDQAVVGLMAAAILRGHFSTFFWGQSYGGVEPYAVAALFALFGQSALSIASTPIVLWAIAALLTWRTTLRLVNDRLIAALAATLVWVITSFGITTAREYGFHNAALVCGMAAMLLALRILDGRHRYIDLAGLGLAVGVGWWASPESAYFIVPAIALVIGAVATTRADHRFQFWAPRLMAAIGASLIGAMPWLWTNILNGFSSLNSSSESSATSGGYWSHLHTFFANVLPLVLGLTTYGSGRPLVHGGLGIITQVAVEAALGFAIVLCLLRPGRSRVIGVATLGFPLLYAINPLAWWWLDGRYSIYLPPLLAMTFAIGCEQAFHPATRQPRKRALHRQVTRVMTNRSRACMVVVMISTLVLAVFGFVGLKGNTPLGIDADPNAPTNHAISVLEQHHVMFGYANYWVAYNLDFLSRERLVLTPGPWDQIRSTPIYDQVASAHLPAWLFVPTDQMAVAAAQFGTTNVETGFDSEANFIDALKEIGDPYSVVHAGIIDAVIPKRPITPRQVGIGSTTR